MKQFYDRWTLLYAAKLHYLLL